MTYLVDTSILGRLANTSDGQYAVATRAVGELHRRGERSQITAQNLIEFRNFATRPAALNGLGLPASEAEARAERFELLFPLLPETPDVYPAWKLLAHASGAIGKQVHDLRLIAVCQVHGVSHILTFNSPHFTRFAGALSTLTVVDPVSV